jgi:hypothetical protein
MKSKTQKPSPLKQVIKYHTHETTTKAMSEKGKVAPLKAIDGAWEKRRYIQLLLFLNLGTRRG